jgi:hypothetical protein
MKQIVVYMEILIELVNQNILKSNFYRKYNVKKEMNIFFLHITPEVCAQLHSNVHVIKMALETTQLLCSVHHMIQTTYVPPYKLSHKNHPCSIWVRTSLSNYKWLCQFGIELCKEYTYRYGKIHKCQAIIEELYINLPDISDLGFTEPPQCMPDMYKDDDFVEGYRQYYIFAKSHIHKWKKRDIPFFIKEVYDIVGKENIVIEK